MKNKKLDKAALAAMLPHANGMVLISAVDSWSDTRISCVVESPREAENPLAIEGRVSVFAGVEYAAQAMALHNALGAQSRVSFDNSDASPRQGVVAVVSKLHATVRYLSDICHDLNVVVDLVDAAGDSSMYDFELLANNECLLRGRLLVLLV